MDVQLDLSAHCIETEIKRRYNLEISAYFKAGLEEQQRLEPIIDTLRLALETFDFAKLRTRYPALAGGGRHNIRISRKNKRVFIAIDNTTINPLDERNGPAFYIQGSDRQGCWLRAIGCRRGGIAFPWKNHYRASSKLTIRFRGNSGRNLCHNDNARVDEVVRPGASGA